MPIIQLLPLALFVVAFLLLMGVVVKSMLTTTAQSPYIDTTSTQYQASQYLDNTLEDRQK